MALKDVSCDMFINCKLSGCIKEYIYINVTNMRQLRLNIQAPNAKDIIIYFPITGSSETYGTLEYNIHKRW